MTLRLASLAQGKTGARTLVVIPVHNEAATIETVVRRAMRHAPVCVVDDCSTDETPAILARLEGVHVIRHEKNTNYGGAVLTGMRYGLNNGYDYVVTMDAGLSHDPDELPRFLGAGEADFVIGVRHAAHEWHVPVHRKVLSRAGTVLMRLALWRLGGRERLHDCTSGYRRYSRAALMLLTETPLQGRGFDFVLETAGLMSWSGVSISEVPISYRRTNSTLGLRAVWNALRMWWTLFSRHDPAFNWRRAKRIERPNAQAPADVPLDGSG
jgi:dolichol-phosphate mannosyltransferase